MAFPPARGERLAWEGLPGEVRAAIEQRLGAPVARTVTKPGGFSPGLAARLELEDGRRVFAKAVGPEPNRPTPGICTTRGLGSSLVTSPTRATSAST